MKKLTMLAAMLALALLIAAPASAQVIDVDDETSAGGVTTIPDDGFGAGFPFDDDDGFDVGGVTSFEDDDDLGDDDLDDDDLGDDDGTGGDDDEGMDDGDDGDDD